jgi:hypothetical protein
LNTWILATVPLNRNLAKKNVNSLIAKIFH